MPHLACWKYSCLLCVCIVFVCPPQEHKQVVWNVPILVASYASSTAFQILKKTTTIDKMDVHCYRNKVCHVRMLAIKDKDDIGFAKYVMLVASHFGLIFVNKRHTTKSTIYIPQKFLRVWYKEWTIHCNWPQIFLLSIFHFPTVLCYIHCININIVINYYII